MGNNGNKPIQVAFGSPGGKTRLADKIVGVMPQHRVYVEPFAGGAAVYFKKGVSESEVLNDKDANIAFAFKFIANMTPQQYAALKRKNWRSSEQVFNQLKNSNPKNDIDRFYKFYYMKWSSFGSGGKSYSPLRQGQTKDISRLHKLHERLKSTRVHNTTAIKLIDKYDSPTTLFYLDPPYPQRAFIGQSFKDFTTKDLAELVNKLKHIKGRYILSLGTEHAKYLPASMNIKRVKLRRIIPSGDGEWNQSFQYEILATNYDTESPKYPRFRPISSRMPRISPKIPRLK